MANLSARSGAVPMELRKSTDQVGIPSGIRKTGCFDTTRFWSYIFFPFSTVGKALQKTADDLQSKSCEIARLSRQTCWKTSRELEPLSDLMGLRRVGHIFWLKNSPEILWKLFERQDTACVIGRTRPTLPKKASRHYPDARGRGGGWTSCGHAGQPPYPWQSDIRAISAIVFGCLLGMQRQV